MTGPPRRRLESALRDAGLEGVQVTRATGGYRVGFSEDDYTGFIAAQVVRHNIAQDTLSTFASTWAEAAGLISPTPTLLDELNAALDRLIEREINA